MKKQPKSDVQNARPLSLIPKTKPSYEDIKLINPKKVPLTPEVLRTFEGFEYTSDEEAENICPTSFDFAYILLDFLARKNRTPIDNQQVISLKEDENKVIGKPPKTKAA